MIGNSGLQSYTEEAGEAALRALSAAQRWVSRRSGRALHQWADERCPRYAVRRSVRVARLASRAEALGCTGDRRQRGDYRVDPWAHLPSLFDRRLP